MVDASDVLFDDRELGIKVIKTHNRPNTLYPLPGGVYVEIRKYGFFIRDEILNNIRKSNGNNCGVNRFADVSANVDYILKRTGVNSEQLYKALLSAR